MILLKVVLLVTFISSYQCRKPDKVYCVDDACHQPISKAKTLLSYNSLDPDLISYKGNTEATVYMKSAGSNPDLWFAKINDQNGFVASNFLREFKILEKNPSVIVSVDKIFNLPVQPQKVQQAHEVVEGTTIYSSEQPTETPVTESIPSFEHAISTEPKLDILEEQILDIPNIENKLSHNTDSSDKSSPNELNSEDNQNLEKEGFNELENFTINSGATENSNFVETDKTVGDLNVDKEQPSSTPVEEENYGNNEKISPEMKSDYILLPPILQPQDTIGSNSGNFIVSEGNSEPIVISKDLDKSQVMEKNDQNKSATLSNEELNLEVHSENVILDQSESDDKLIENGEKVFQYNNGESQNLIPTLEHNTDIVFSAEIPTVATIESDTSNVFQSLDKIDETTIESKISGAEDNTLTSTTKNSHDEVTENYKSLLNDALNSYDVPKTPEDNLVISSTEDNLIDLPTENTQIQEDKIESEEIKSTTPSSIFTETDSGILDGLFSTVGNIWPSSTESTLADLPDEPIYMNIEPLEPATETQDISIEENSFSYFKYFVSAYKSALGLDDSSELFVTKEDSCSTNEYCEDSSRDHNNRLLFFLLTTASSVLLFTLGYYYIDHKRQDGRLVGMVNSLQRELLCITKECEILKEELTTTKSKLAGIEDNSFGMDDMVQSLKDEIAEMKAQNDRLRNSLDDNEKLLRVSENTAGELQNTLSEVENTLSELLSERAHSEEHIASLLGQIQEFEEELISVSRDRDAYQLKYVSAEAAAEDVKALKRKMEELNKNLQEANNCVQLQKHELTALKDCIKELKNNTSSGGDVTTLIDNSEIKAKLSKALDERVTFENKYETESKEKVRLQEELKIAQESLRHSTQQASEAVTRLDVLGKYFQEREGELLKELNAKESLWLSKQGESASTVEKIELLQQEVQRFKEKCDSLTLELAEQESSRRTVVAELENRAHSAWLEARASKREAAADKEACAALRRKLASLGAPLGPTASPNQRIASPLDASSGDVGIVPPPLPPHAFLPPLLPPLPRPPPLGRLPSPLNRYERRYSPDSRYSPESRYSPSSRYSPPRYSPDSRYSPSLRARSNRDHSPLPRRSREGYQDGRGSRQRNGIGSRVETETEYGSESPSRSPRRRGRYSRHSGPSSGSGCSSESDK